MSLRLPCTFIALCLFAVFMMAFPFTPAFALLNPPWLCLIIIYFALYMPLHAGIGVAALVGLCADIVIGSVWGANAIALTIVMYLFLLQCHRIRHHPIWQQSMWVGLFAGLNLLSVNWVEGLAGYGLGVSDIIIKTCVSILIWPLLFVVLNRVLRVYRLE